MEVIIGLSCIKEIKNASECIVVLYKHAGIFKNTTEKFHQRSVNKHFALYCNYFQIRALSGLVFLLQHDHQMEANNWFSAIAAVIKRLVRNSTR